MKLHRIIAIAVITLALAFNGYAKDPAQGCSKVGQACCKSETCCVKDAACPEAAACCKKAECCDHGGNSKNCGTAAAEKSCCKKSCDQKTTKG